MNYFKEQLKAVPTGESASDIPDFSSDGIEQENDAGTENEIPAFFAENKIPVENNTCSRRMF